VSLRVAFPLLGGAIWTGGQSYMRNLFRVLATTAAERVAPVLMAPAGTTVAALAAFSDIKGLEILELPAIFSNRLRSRAFAIFLGRDRKLEHWLRAQGIDLVFEATDFIGWRNRLPALAWMPDFQHKHLPAMFEWSRLWGRELLYQLQTRSGRTIMLSSEATRRECECFYPASRGRTVVVPFCVPAGAARPAAGLASRYDLPPDYLYLPNQFWKHKNHGVIVDALSLLRSQGRKVVVLASGNPSDVRDPGYFPALLERIAKLDLGDSWRLLGMIPYEDVLGLMQSSVAVVNPSLVEGWSTTVEEAKSLQVPLVLSDIPVHREQASRDAIFFDPHAPQSAADALSAACERFGSRPRGAARTADPTCEERLRTFGTAFSDAVGLAVERATPKSPLQSAKKADGLE
jgi:glycosyltransferase involved in cell wall biosynthesis